ncbi:oxidoreductase [Mycolicibacterium conceptionense]|uniref:Oxidoreductase n=1 Tax=Mycolicibacterium conceptionense TaxID=451644 RepID=A0A0U1D1W7_9MYCO|nr:oxidoreductase [Mycolicibacterium conceptionense]
MFTQTLTEGVGRRLLAGPRMSALANLLTGPHGVDRYTELVEPTWTRGDARAKVTAVRRQTPRSVTLTLEPNAAFTGFRAGQHINLSVEINGRRRTRCYSPASAEGSASIELTIGRHDGGLVSTYLCDHAYPGMVLGLDSVGGDFVLPEVLPQRILLVSGGSGITPVLSMLRTLRAQAFTGEIAFLHYARAAEEACYRSELAAMPGIRVLHGYTRDAPVTWTATSARRILRPPFPVARPTRCSSAVRRPSSTPFASSAPMRARRVSSHPCSAFRLKPPAARSPSPAAASR